MSQSQPPVTTAAGTQIATSSGAAPSATFDPVRWLYERWPGIATIIGTIGNGGIGIVTALWSVQMSGQWQTVVFLFAFFSLLQAIGGWRSISHDNERQQLKTQRDLAISRATMFASVPNTFFNYYLIDLFRMLELGNDERISLYMHIGSSFHKLARYAQSPIYNSDGRPLYPDNQGCIAKAWHEGECALSLSDPEKDWEQHKKELSEKFNIPPEVADKFAMRSRSFVGIRLMHPGTHQGIAVLIVESTKKPKALQLTHVKTILNDSKVDEFSRYLGLFEYWLPDPQGTASGTNI